MATDEVSEEDLLFWTAVAQDTRPPRFETAIVARLYRALTAAREENAALRALCMDQSVPLVWGGHEAPEGVSYIAMRRNEYELWRTQQLARAERAEADAAALRIALESTRRGWERHNATLLEVLSLLSDAEPPNHVATWQESGAAALSVLREATAT
jgi:hypothetical protein